MQRMSWGNNHTVEAPSLATVIVWTHIATAGPTAWEGPYPSEDQMTIYGIPRRLGNAQLNAEGIRLLGNPNAPHRASQPDDGGQRSAGGVEVSEIGI